MRFFITASLVALAFACAPSKPGDSCDVHASTDPCPKGLVCQEHNGGGECLVDLGGACEQTAKDSSCAGGSACSNKVCGGTGAACTDDKQCAADACADVGGKNECEPKALIEGQVIDGQTKQGIAGAHVIALDADGAAISKVAISGSDGSYSLELIVARQANGAPQTGATATLRADAKDYASFPGGLRPAIPVALDGAQSTKDGFVVDDATTTIALLALPDAQKGRPSISGTVAAGGGGVLVVAKSSTGVGTGITDSDGSFTIFNAAAGATVVSGYAANVQLTPANVTVAASDVKGVTLAKATAATGSVSGSVNIVNAAGASSTSVVLVVSDTFDTVLERGDTPRGLRAGNVLNSFKIDGVPDGDYIVLAAFENDGLVRDPDTSIAGTGLVHVTVGAGNRDVTAPQSFKVTGALAVVSPGADGKVDTVSGNPTFSWADDSSEDGYDLVVHDAFGNVAWQITLPSHTGGGNVSADYNSDGTGQALVPGMIYQFRATSFRNQNGGPGGGTGTVPISETEDLKGTFTPSG